MGHKLFSGALALVLVVTCCTALALLSWWLPLVFGLLLAFFLWHRGAYIETGTVVAVWDVPWAQSPHQDETEENN